MVYVLYALVSAVGRVIKATRKESSINKGFGRVSELSEQDLSVGQWAHYASKKHL